MSFAHELHAEHKARRDRLWPAKQSIKIIPTVTLCWHESEMDKLRGEIKTLREELALRPNPSADPVNLPMAPIRRAVAEFYGTTLLEMDSPRRAQSAVVHRHIAMYLCKIMTDRSLPEIGRRFGNKDHTTVLWAVRKIEARRKNDLQLDEDLIKLERIISGDVP